jgi:hypothetical protein
MTGPFPDDRSREACETPCQLEIPLQGGEGQEIDLLEHEAEIFSLEVGF